MIIKTKAALFRDFLYLHEVIKHHQISAAAMKNGIKASNLSKLIKNLEDISGKRLFIRQPQGLIPTTEALKMAEMITQIEKLFDQAAGHIFSVKADTVLKLYLPDNLVLKNLERFSESPVSLCRDSDTADVIVAYSAPPVNRDLISVENHIGTGFSQTLWVSAVNQENALSLARFIIGEMHSQ